MARKGEKVVAIAYRDFDLDEFEHLLASNQNFEVEESRQLIESHLTMAAIFGMHDNARDNISAIVQEVKDAGLEVRLLSGDHIETALYFAETCQITPDRSWAGEMSGEEVESKLNEWMVEARNESEGGESYKFRNESCKNQFRDEFLKKVFVVYRCTPKQKHMITAAFRQSKKITAVTGRSISDALALKEANVGFAMGLSGCSVAKDHANIIVLDDSFQSVSNAAKWGQNIYDNCRKFIQFQATVNISCLLIVVLGGATLGKSPFSIIQMLWINLFMDVLAAIALATEAPNPQNKRSDRIKLDEEGQIVGEIITPYMKRTILSQVVYQFLVMVVLLYLGPLMFDIKYDMVHDSMRNADGHATNRLVHYTLCFHTFVLMNLFNTFNCRTLPCKDEKAYNVFAGIHRNWWFLLIVLAEFNLQFAMISGFRIMHAVFQTSTLTLGMHITALTLGLGSFGVAALVKATPNELVEKMPAFDEDGAAAFIDQMEEKMLKKKLID